jgi:hypothetical protein
MGGSIPPGYYTPGTIPGALTDHCSYWLVLLPTLLGTRIDGGIWLLDMALGLQPRAVNEPAW